MLFSLLYTKNFIVDSEETMFFDELLNPGDTINVSTNHLHLYFVFRDYEYVIAEIISGESHQTLKGEQLRNVVQSQLEESTLIVNVTRTSRVSFAYYSLSLPCKNAIWSFTSANQSISFSRSGTGNKMLNPDEVKCLLFAPGGTSTIFVENILNSSIDRLYVYSGKDHWHEKLENKTYEFTEPPFILFKSYDKCINGSFSLRLTSFNHQPLITDPVITSSYHTYKPRSCEHDSSDQTGLSTTTVFLLGMGMAAALVAVLYCVVCKCHQLRCFHENEPAEEVITNPTFVPERSHETNYNLSDISNNEEDEDAMVSEKIDLYKIFGDNSQDEETTNGYEANPYIESSSGNEH